MAQYAYHAVDYDGKKYHGQLDVANETKLYEMLRLQGRYVTSCHVVNENTSNKKKVKFVDLSMLCRQMGSMLKAGMSMSDALQALCQKSSGVVLKGVCFSLYEQIQKGTSLSKAMRLSIYAFPPLMLHMVHAAELSGQLDDTFQQLHHYFEAENKMRNRVITAMTYPVMLFGVTIVIVIFLMTNVLPKFFHFFESSAQLPLVTRILMMISNSLTQHWYFHVLNVLLMMLLIQHLKRSSSFQEKMDTWKVTMPLFGKLNRIVYTSRFARTFANLYQSQVSIVDSLQVCVEVLSNKYYANHLAITSQSIQNGNSISDSLAEAKCFDDLLISMVYVGEQSGELDGVLRAVSEYYDNESQRATDQMITMLQPIMILVLGLIIFFVLVGVLSGVYSTYTGV